jgi:succinate dehydrogenase / fumarate reductase flavoprotein subunit
MTLSHEQVHLVTDVLIVGSGGAGMAAALSAAGKGAEVVLADRSLIGRSGATVMAQMTVAAALGEEVPDHWEYHLADTLTAGRGLCDADLAALVCEHGPKVIRQFDDWRVGWARARWPHPANPRTWARSRALRLCRLPFDRAGCFEDPARPSSTAR